MKNSEDHIEKLKELTPELMQRYAQGTLSPQQQRAVELYLLDNPFEAEAMEGLAHADDFKADMAKLKSRLGDIMDKPEAMVIPLWQQPLKIAAAVALLIVGSFVIINSFNWFEKDNTELALNDIKEDDKIDENLKKESNEKKDEPLLAEDEFAGQEEASVVEESKLEKMEEEPKPLSKSEADRESIDVVEDNVEENNIEEIDAEEDVLADTDLEDASSGEAQALSLVDNQEAEIAEDNAIATKEPEFARSSAISNARQASKKKSRQLDNQPSQSRTVSGKITSIDDGSALPGVNVVVKGTTTGTITDIDGEYELELSESDEIVVSYIGYASEEIAIGARDVIDVALGADVKQLSEVVVTGSGAQITDPKPSLNARPVEGYSSLKAYLNENLQYPIQARDSVIEGKVTLEFYVEENGSLSDIEIVKSLGYGCDEEALRLIKEGPKWEPAKNEGEPYRKKVRVKIKFELE